MAVTVRPMDADDVPAVVRLLRAVFEEFVRPDYSDEGWTTLLDYVNVEAMRERNRKGHRSWVAEIDGEVVGVLELRRTEHVSQLAVAADHFRRRIARSLLEEAVACSRRENPGLDLLTVHASPYAIPAYERLGFEARAGEVVVSGIRFTPMALKLNAEDV